MTQPRFLKLHAADNVIIAAESVPAGAALGGDLKARGDIERGHKIAIASIEPGRAVRKLGHVIGIATRSIAAGEHVHDHNLRTPSAAETAASIAEGIQRPTRPVDAAATPLSFKGYRRTDGRTATRNYIGVLTTVNCSATVARGIADAFKTPDALSGFPNVDGVVAFTHASGCGMQSQGLGHTILQRTIEGYLRHPNFAAVLLVGLGCEVNGRASYFSEAAAPERFQSFDIQARGGTRQAIASGIARVRELLGIANAVRRELLPARELVVGLQCGGSDAFSALTANPALGIAADLLVAQGATVILSETPEVAPWAEMLCARAVSADIAERMRTLVRWWEDYAAQHGTTLDGNPSPGNRAGGLSTIAEKALGAIAKGGSSPLIDVLGYAEPVTKRGLVYMDSPGFDPVSATGQIASGANLVCFTTGRGSVFGSKPAPCLKLATNSELFMRMRDDMDIDCGGVLDGRTDLDALGQQIFSRMLAVTSGQPTQSELLAVGDNEFAPWQLGAVL